MYNGYQYYGPPPSGFEHNAPPPFAQYITHGPGYMSQNIGPQVNAPTGPRYSSHHVQQLMMRDNPQVWAQQHPYGCAYPPTFEDQYQLRQLDAANMLDSRSGGSRYVGDRLPPRPSSSHTTDPPAETFESIVLSTLHNPALDRNTLILIIIIFLAIVGGFSLMTTLMTKLSQCFALNTNNVALKTDAAT